MNKILPQNISSVTCFEDREGQLYRIYGNDLESKMLIYELIYPQRSSRNHNPELPYEDFYKAQEQGKLRITECKITCYHCRGKGYIDYEGYPDCHCCKGKGEISI